MPIKRLPILAETAALLALTASLALVFGPYRVSPWLRLDALSATMLLLVTFIGWVVVRYATTGDTMDIESLSLGGGFFREAVATLSTCITKAPASWYQVPPMGKVPALNLRNVADAEALADLYRGYSAWREAFRTSGK